MDRLVAGGAGALNCRCSIVNVRKDEANVQFTSNISAYDTSWNGKSEQYVENSYTVECISKVKDWKRVEGALVAFAIVNACIHEKEDKCCNSDNMLLLYD